MKITFARVTFTEYVLNTDMFLFDALEQTDTDQFNDDESNTYKLMVSGEAIAKIIAVAATDAEISWRDACIATIFEDFEGGDPAELVGRNFEQGE